MSGIVGKNAGRASGIIGAGDIADESIDSDHYVDASIDNAHLADDAVNSDELAAGAVDLAHMSAESVDSDQYVDGSIDEAHIADNAVTLAKMAGGTDGNIISFDASGDPVAIATGNDGQVLTSTGAGSPPAFEAVSAGTDNASVAFHAMMTASASSVTGDGTNWDGQDTTNWTDSSGLIAYDTGSDFTTTNGTFTAPQDGTYFFYAVIALGGADGDCTYYTVWIRTTDKMYTIMHGGVQELAWSGTMYNNGCLTCKMEEDDTAFIEVDVVGGAKTVNVNGSSNETFFGGFLIG